MKHSLAIALAMLLSYVGAASAQEDILIADFEGPNYGAWTATGDAFGPAPAHGTLASQQAVSGFNGKGLVNTYLNGDKSTGTLTSPEFKIERKFINFLVGGGAHEGKVCINLLADGKIVRTTTGPDDERLDWATWNVADLAGKTVRIQIVDNVTNGWGHINVDDIIQSNTPKHITPEPRPLYDEVFRPQFHFSAKTNWLNDPNGMVFYKGEYHLFLQHNPSGINWGNMTWAHAVSPDMVHWQQIEHALLPDKLGTMFSGSAVVDWDNTAGFQKGDEKTIVLIYTAAGGASPESKGQPFTQCIAYSTDRGRTFTKYEKNPVLPHIVGGNRDPKVIWFAPTKRWIMALFKDKTLFAFFESPDLKSWTHLQDIDLPGSGECPDFFPMPVDGDKNNQKWILTAANGHYLIGSFDGKKFTPETQKPIRADWGRNYYAVQTYSDIPDADGRRIQIAWMQGGKYPKMPFNQQMSFPCEMKLRTFPEGLRITRTPVKEIESLRTKINQWGDTPLKDGENPLSAITGELFDVRAEIELGDAAEVGFKIRGETVSYLAKEQRLTSLGSGAQMPPANARITLQILVDRSSLEVFGNDGKTTITSCFLPKQDNKSLAIYAKGGTAKILSLNVYELKSAWKAGQ